MLQFRVCAHLVALKLETYVRLSFHQVGALDSRPVLNPTHSGGACEVVDNDIDDFVPYIVIWLVPYPWTLSRCSF